MELFGIELIGINPENGRKVLLTLAAATLLWLVSRALSAVAQRWLADRAFFWGRQGLRLATALLMLLAIVSIWFDEPARLATGFGLITAGLAFALQKLVAAVAGYFVILHGETFNVGDRITMGGVRGDVIALSFTQTTIMEMGQPPAVQGADPAQWVRSRQYTGRVVTVSNARVFDEPVYNYTREFPYIWEEISVPVAIKADHSLAERALLEIAERHTLDTATLGEAALQEMERRFFVKASQMRPAVYYRLTDNWVELTVRFIASTHGIRELKDSITREILEAFAKSGIGIASSTLEIVALPELRLQSAPVSRNARRP